MDHPTRYRYEQRIKELERSLSLAQNYRYLALKVFDAAQENADNNNLISKKWLLAQFRDFLK